MSTRRIIEAFDTWRGQSTPMALVTVYDTLGSTYTKAGHRIVFAADGSYAGLISGGCLEGDIAEHALRVLENRSARPLTYDLRDEVDDVFGLGVGCNGLIRVFIQPLLPENDYAPFAALRELYDGSQAVLSATVIESKSAEIAPGTTCLVANDGVSCLLDDDSASDALAKLIATELDRETLAATTARYLEIAGCGVLLSSIVPIPRLLILGAGLDAVPIVRMAAELGWRVDIVDHRPAYLEREDLASADTVRLVDPRDPENVTSSGQNYDAAVVMSHHLETDAAWLRALAPLGLRYLGVLGPPARREKLLERLEPEFPELRRQLHGPIGLDIGSASPEAIALSILAELQSVFNGAQ